MKKWKQALCITLIIIGVLVFSAIVIGILNATVFDGAINFGWTNYRYESTGYNVGEGTVYATEITAIDVDWLDGRVEIVSCEDAYLSISEQTADALPDSARVHWAVSEDGKTLTIKARESGWFFGNSNEKTLTLRIPERMLSQLTSLTVAAKEAPIAVTDISAPTVSISNEKGNVSYASATCPESLTLVCPSGNVSLKLAKNASFTLTWEHKSGRMISDFAMQESGNVYTVSTGSSRILVQTKSGDLVVSAQQ